MGSLDHIRVLVQRSRRCLKQMDSSTRQKLTRQGTLLSFVFFTPVLVIIVIDMYCFHKYCNGVGVDTMTMVPSGSSNWIRLLKS